MATMLALSGILFTGDSDIEGWATAAEFPKSVNVGVGGATCGDVAKKAEGYISTYCRARLSSCAARTTSRTARRWRKR